MFRLIAALLFIGVVACTEYSDFCKESWAKYHSATKTGTDIFYHFFEQNPDIESEFPKFANVELSNLKQNADFQAHATKIHHVSKRHIQGFYRLLQLYKTTTIFFRR